MNWDPISEHQAGVLCEKGFMKERYEESVDELIKTFTPKGIAKVKEILKNPEYQKDFLRILYNEIKDLPRNAQIGIVKEVEEMLR